MYIASSVVGSLTGNQSLSVTGMDQVSCPVESCVMKPEECSKGQAKICEKKIEVIYDYKGRKSLVFLIFRYQLHGTEGFIRRQDSALNVLLRRNIINQENLIPAQDFH